MVLSAEKWSLVLCVIQGLRGSAQTGQWAVDAGQHFESLTGPRNTHDRSDGRGCPRQPEVLPSARWMKLAKDEESDAQKQRHIFRETARRRRNIWTYHIISLHLYLVHYASTTRVVRSAQVSLLGFLSNPSMIMVQIESTSWSSKQPLS